MTKRFWKNVAAWWGDIADRAVKSAAQGAILGIGSGTAADGAVNGLAFDWQWIGGLALGAAVLSLLTNVAQRGFSGKQPQSSTPSQT